MHSHALEAQGSRQIWVCMNQYVQWYLCMSACMHACMHVLYINNICWCTNSMYLAIFGMSSDIQHDRQRDRRTNKYTDGYEGG